MVHVSNVVCFVASEYSCSFCVAVVYLQVIKDTLKKDCSRTYTQNNVMTDNRWAQQTNWRAMRDGTIAGRTEMFLLSIIRMPSVQTWLHVLWGLFSKTDCSSRRLRSSVRNYKKILFNCQRIGCNKGGYHKSMNAESICTESRPT